ncbi:hypothetical protein Tco_0791222 [Tanacetum coccineum]
MSNNVHRGTFCLITPNNQNIDGENLNTTRSLPITVIDLMKTDYLVKTLGTVAPTPSSAIIQRPISDNFRIKGIHMQLIQDNQFDVRIRSDPHRQVADFLEISNLFQYGENQEKAVMLRKFPFSLCEEAKIWLNELKKDTLLYGPTQGILDAGGIFLYNTPNEAFQILEDKVLLKLDFSDEFQISPKTVVSASGSNIDSYHAMLMEKFKYVITKSILDS